MDRQQVREWESKCIQEQAPACTATCPVHVDVRGLAQSVRNADFAGGFAIFSRFIPLPGIIGRICDHPCEAACRRQESGDIVAIRALEQSCCDHAYRPLKPSRLRANGKRIAIVGGGLSGVIVAIDLATKGSDVTIYESNPRLLDRLFRLGESVLPAHLISADLQVLTSLGVEVRCNHHVDGQQFEDLSRQFDAVYVGIGEASTLAAVDIERRNDGRIALDPLTFATSRPNIFGGGTHRYATVFSPITSLQDGRYAALSIDRFLQGASLSASRENQGSFASRLFVNTRGRDRLPRVIPANPALGYTQDEAVCEAARCFPCECLECVKVCEYLAHYKSYPKRYVREIYNNDCIVMGAHPANRMVNTCSLCGLCEAVCPEKLSMAEICLDARRSMVAKSKMPPSAHDFALRDLAFSTSSAFQLARHQPGFTASEAVFFPGCQLSASSPRHVFRAYEYLTSRIAGGVGLMMGCCGAPAYWAGEQTLFSEVVKPLREQWEQMGRPRLITACSSCHQILKDHLPEIPVESLWTLLDRLGLPNDTPECAPKTLAIHDPCTTREDAEVQASVRRILADIGADTVELNDRGLTTCCGYGGLMQFADANVAEKVVDRRIQQSPADYVTYCAMCRDNFARRGKRSMHILDMVFATDTEDPAARPDPGFSARQENRTRLKTRLLRELWREPVPDEEVQLKLTISTDVLALMEKRLILLDDVRKVISNAEKTGQKMINEAGRFIACRRSATVTYWVEYTSQDDGFAVHNVYSHRMEVGSND